MEKASYWFRHDRNAHQDIKIVRLRSQMGWEGYGLYWALIEHLSEASEYKIAEDDKALLTICLSIDEAKLNQFLSICLNVELLVNEGGYIYSQSLCRRMEEFDNIRKKRAEAGRKGGSRSKSKANAKAKLKQKTSKPQAKNKQIRVEESREDKSKEEKKTIQIPVDPPAGVSIDLWTDFFLLREELKAKNTERALNGLVKILEGSPESDRSEMVEQSIINSWKSVFPLKKQTHDRKSDSNKQVDHEYMKTFEEDDGTLFGEPI